MIVKRISSWRRARAARLRAHVFILKCAHGTAPTPYCSGEHVCCVLARRAIVFHATDSREPAKPGGLRIVQGNCFGDALPDQLLENGGEVLGSQAGENGTAFAWCEFFGNFWR